MDYIIDTNRIKQNFYELEQYGKIYYPLKTNHMQEVVECITELNNSRFLISNINQATKLRITLENSISINTLLSVDKLIILYNLGIRSFVFDNYIKMKQFLHEIHDNSVEITVKISLTQFLNINVNTGANESEEKSIVEYLDNFGYTYGYSIYINSEAKKIIDKNKLLSFVQNRISNKQIRFISIGGIEDIGNTEYSRFLSCLQSLCVDNQIEFRIEPGDRLINNAVDTLATIIDIHSNKNSISITINGSTYREFYDTIAFGKVFDFYSIEGKSVNKIYKEKVYNGIEIHIFGNSSDSNDYIGRFYIKDKSTLSVGDNIRIKNTGAYFNRMYLI